MVAKRNSRGRLTIRYGQDGRCTKVRADYTLKRIREGATLKAIAEELSLPGPFTIADWACRPKNPIARQFALDYQTARDVAAELLVDQIRELTDQVEGSNVKALDCRMRHLLALVKHQQGRQARAVEGPALQIETTIPEPRPLLKVVKGKE